MRKENKTKYIIYARKSSETEDRQVASIDSQIKELEKIAKEFDLEVYKILKEPKSAKAPGRPEFNNMIEMIKKGEANGILCWKLDRLARNPIDGGEISWLLQQNIIHQIQTYGRIYRPEDNVLMMAVELGMANQFIRDLSCAVKRGLRAKAERGYYPTYASIGYIHNPLKEKGDKEIIKDPDRFYLVRKMFDLILSEKHSPLRALEIITKKGLRTKRGKFVGRSTIYRILKDPFYYGMFEYPKGSGKWYQGKHEPMITEGEYEKIQSMIFNKDNKSPLEKKDFRFRGPLYCAECGASVTAEYKTKKQKNGNVHHYIYYHCTKRKRIACSQKGIEEKELEKQIRKRLEKINTPPEFHLWAIKWLRKMIKEDFSEEEKLLRRYKKEYEECKEEIDGIIGMRARNEIDRENYQRRKDFLEKEKARLYGLINNKNDKVEEKLKKAEKLFTFSRDALETFNKKDPQKQKEMMIGLGSNLTIKDKEFTILEEEILFGMERVSSEVKNIHENVRTAKNGLDIGKLEELYDNSSNLLWR